MKSNRGIITALLGIAMLATPVSALARDHGWNRSTGVRGGAAFNHPAPMFHPAVNSNVNVRAFAPPAREYRPAPAARAWQRPAFVENRTVVEREYVPVKHWDDGDGYDRHYWKHHHEPDADDYGYRQQYYQPAPYYSGTYGAVPYYGGGYGNPNACANAQRLYNQYQQYRMTGHHSAAQNVFARMQGPFHRCQNQGGITPGGGGYGYGGYYGGVNASNYLGLNNGYYNNGYYNNNGYGASSLLGPLLQFVP